MRNPLLPLRLDIRSANAVLAVSFMHAQHLKSSINIVFCYLCCRYFSRQELRDLFTLDDPYTSKTQMQLEKMHSHHRKTDEELDKHIAFLYSLSKFHWSCCRPLPITLEDIFLFQCTFCLCYLLAFHVFLQFSIFPLFPMHDN